MTFRGARSVCLKIEELEPRELPSSTLTVDTFENNATRSAPAGWTQWSNEGTTSFLVTNGAGFGSNNALVSNGDSKLAGRAWLTSTYQNNVQIQADIYLNSLAPLQLFARGANLTTTTPTYYAVSVTRGMEVDLLRVDDGKTTVLSTVVSTSYLSNKWVQIGFTVEGNQLTVQVFRADTAQYLGPDDAWHDAPTAAIAMTDSAITNSGRVGLIRAPGASGQVAIDNVEVNTSPPTSAPTTLIDQNFSSNLSAGLPAGWSSYTNTSGQTFQVASSSPALPGSTSIGVTGSTGLVARAWTNAALPADVEVSASLYLNNLAPAQIFARGQDLDTASPDYYAVSLVRGSTVQLISVVNGVTTVLGTATTDAWFGQQWVQATLSVAGSTLSVQIYRMDTGQYLSSNGLWQATPTWAIQQTDTSILGAGLAGIGRAAGSSGSVFFDNFFVLSVPGSSASSSSSASLLNNINSTPIGSLPSDWSSWTRNGIGGFQVAAEPAPSTSNGLASNGGSTAAARAWFNMQTYSDVQLSGSVYVDGLVPAQILVRGSDLNTSTPNYYAVSVTRGLDVELLKVVDGQTTVLGNIGSVAYLSGVWVTVGLQAQANTLEVVIERQDTNQYLTATGTWQSAQAIALTATDADLTSGYVGVNRPASYSGRALFDNISVVNLAATSSGSPPSDPSDSTNPGGSTTTTTGGSTSVSSGVQHYPYIRVAELAYYGTPIGNNEIGLLQNGVDLVVANPAYLSEINSISPNTTQLIYTNVSNIYEGLLTSWMYYAYQNNINPEAAFYHVTTPTPFSGTSGSSEPVDWFWSVQLGNSATGWTDFTSNSSRSAQDFPLGNVGQALVVGYPDPFNIVNLTFSAPAGDGWSAVLQYASSADANGNPTGWTTLQTLTNTTKGYTSNGQIIFNPPANWAMSMINGSDPLYYLRILTTSNGAAPVVNTILGNDYVHANGGTSGVIPVFDYALDTSHVGYLTPAQYVIAEKAGDFAQFAYQSRLFYPSYGQMRFATDVSNPQFKQWAVLYSYEYLNDNPLADGLFVDNSISKLSISPGSVRESITNYSVDYGAVLEAIDKKIAPRWILANTAGAGTAAAPLIEDGVSWMEEFGLRPLASNSSQFIDTANLIQSRLALSRTDYAVIDTYPAGGSPTDSRTEIAELAEYYLVANSQSFVMFNGGYAPASAWNQHWTNAVNFNVGKPLGTWSIFATGPDPESPALTYTVFERKYQNALVLYKPLSYSSKYGSGTLDDDTATTFKLNGTYRPLNADGTLGAPITKITLLNGEGAILVPD
jgi:hypothetical protein